MTNFLEETKRVLRQNDKSPLDVLWVGDGEYAINWHQFQEIANFDYDNGYGGAEIVEDICVVGNDWWLERHEYDGSEWWEYKTIPRITEGKKFTKIKLENYESGLGELNEQS